MSTEKHISVCICTFQRPSLLRNLLERLERQQTNGKFTFSIVVTDNDAGRSSEHVVADFAASCRAAVRYSCEPRQNIALARNAVLKHATGDFVAFIDDDEYPENDWLSVMLAACEAYHAAGVMGPVRPRFEETPPRWVIDGGFCDRPEHATGWIMPWRECRTGNVLFSSRLLDGMAQPFNPKFRTGGEDVDFFRRLIKQGYVFRWCNEGIVYETVPKERCTRKYMLKRAMLRGRHSVTLPFRRLELAGKSIVAVPVYLAMMPFTLLLGQHVFMKYCIRICDHAGRLLTLLRLNPVRDR
jgi:glycosyltransferase involved in cell wall biosynthesis